MNRIWERERENKITFFFRCCSRSKSNRLMPQSTFDALPLFFIRIQCASSVFLLFEAKIKMSRVLAVARQCEFFSPHFLCCSASVKNLILQHVWLGRCHCSSFCFILQFSCCCYFWWWFFVAVAIAAAAVTASAAAALVVIVIFGSVFSVPLPGFCALSICWKWKKTISWVESNTQSDFDIDEFDVICHSNPKRIGEKKKKNESNVYAYTAHRNTHSHPLQSLASHILDVTLTNKNS